MLPLDETAARLIASAAGMVAAGLAVADAMLHGMVTTATHLGLAVSAMVAVRWVVVSGLMPRRPAAPAPDPAPAPEPED